MAISETTKQVVKQQRQTLLAKYEANLKDIAELEAHIIAIKAANVTLKAKHDALKRDIADPTPAPVEHP